MNSLLTKFYYNYSIIYVQHSSKSSYIIHYNIIRASQRQLTSLDKPEDIVFYTKIVYLYLSTWHRKIFFFSWFGGQISIIKSLVQPLSKYLSSIMAFFEGGKGPSSLYAASLTFFFFFFLNQYDDII